MVCLPEHFAYMTNEIIRSTGKIDDFRDNKCDNELLKKYRQLALDHQVWLSLGCFPEYDPITGHY